MKETDSIILKARSKGQTDRNMCEVLNKATKKWVDYEEWKALRDWYNGILPIKRINPAVRSGKGILAQIQETKGYTEDTSLDMQLFEKFLSELSTKNYKNHE